MLELASSTPFRYHEFLYEQWNKLRGTRSFPLMNEIDMAALAKIADYCFVIALGNHEENTPYYYLSRGPKVTTATGEDAEAISFLFENERTPLNVQLDQVEIQGKPLTENGEFIDSNNRIVRYRRALLPLGDGSGHVGYVIGCVRWKFFNTDEVLPPAAGVWDDPAIR